MQGDLSQGVLCNNPRPCPGHQGTCRGFFALIFTPLGLSPFPSGNQSCCPALASSPKTAASQWVLDPLAWEAWSQPFLEDGDQGWMEASLNVDQEQKLGSLLEQLIS